MALTHKEAVKRKKASLDEIKDKMNRSAIAVLTDYRGDGKGMSVKAITQLRQNLRETDSEYRIYKNTLCRIAFKELGVEGLLDQFVKPTAIAFGYKDSAATCKVLAEFLKTQKDNPLPRIKAAYMDGEVYDEKQVKVLATLPGRDELLSQLLRTMNGPAQGFVTVCAAVPRGFVTVLDRIREKKEKGEL